MHLTAASLVHLIAQLDRKRLYDYVNPSNRKKIRITRVIEPCGPIYYKRYDPALERQASAKEQSIPVTAIAAIAEHLATGLPVNFDAVLFNSGNYRSALESIVAHLSPFYITYPDVVISGNGKEEVRRRAKHVIMRRDGGHTPGMIAETEPGMLVTESPRTSYFAPLTLPQEAADRTQEPVHHLKRHARIQSSLIYIGAKFGAEIWIDPHDQAIRDADVRFGDKEGMIKDLSKMILMNPAALKAATHVDCAWFFRNGLDMPFVFEIEHSTKIVRGLARLQELRSNLPRGLPVRWTIVAADSEFDKARQLASREQFAGLRARFMPYSAVEDLRMRCEQRGLKGTTIEYVDNYLIDLVN